MKRTITLLAVISLCQLAVIGQKKYEMVIEKTDGSEISVNTEDIVKTYFREVTSDNQEDLSLAGHTWCFGTSEEDALGNPNSMEGYVFNTDGTCAYFAIYNNGNGKEKKTGSYTYEGNVLTITTTTSYAWSNNTWTLQTGYGGKTRVFYVSISGNCMTWTGDDNETLYTREGFSVELGEDTGGNSGGSDAAYTSCPDSNHPHLIDLGLPSGTKWACCNVGASKPEDFGNYYAWGETTTKTNYSWSTYTHCNGSSTTIYNIGSDIAGTEYDAATANWGASWKMPTISQCKELRNSCTWSLATENGVVGYQITGPGGGSIFLPAAGYASNAGKTGLNSSGYYWSSTLSSSGQYGGMRLTFFTSWKDIDAHSSAERDYGQSVRAVK